MPDIWNKCRSASVVGLWLAWAAVAWALVSYGLFHASFRIPHVIEIAATMSAAAAFVGGCLAVLYVLMRARKALPITLGLVAALINFTYFWAFVTSLSGTHAS